MNTIALTDNVLRVRKDFSKIPSILEIPDLIEAYLYADISHLGFA